jgi:hypothetical protein
VLQSVYFTTATAEKITHAFCTRVHPLNPDIFLKKDAILKLVTETLTDPENQTTQAAHS